MPLYTIRCVDGHEDEVLTTVDDRDCPCPTCAQPTERIWKGKPPTVIGDACDVTQENGFKEPRHFTSKIERRRALKEAGVEECVQHRPMPGTDKSRHTMNHAQIMDPVTLENARILVSRPGALKGNDALPPVRMRISYVSGELDGRPT